MSNFIYQINDFWLFFLVNGVSLFFSLLAILLIEKFVPTQLRYKENQAIGYVSATICVVFAVLAGFSALFVLTNFNKAGEVVQQEANEAMAIYQDAAALNEPIRSDVQDAIKVYLKGVIEHDWFLMQNGRDVDLTTDIMINRLVSIIHQYSIQSDSPFTLQEISKEIIALRNAREERVRLHHSALGPDIWVVLLLGAFFTIAINYMFGMQFHLHLFSIFAVTLVVSSTIFLLIILDHPFQGKFSISTDAFQNVLNFISYQEKQE